MPKLGAPPMIADLIPALSILALFALAVCCLKWSDR